MNEKKIKVPFPTPNSPLVDGTEVLVAESTERWSDIRLEDGTELRVKTSVLSAVRIEGQHDAEGNPMYVLKANPMMAVVTVPAQFRKNASSKVQ